MTGNPAEMSTTLSTLWNLLILFLSAIYSSYILVSSLAGMAEGCREKNYGSVGSESAGSAEKAWGICQDKLYYDGAIRW
jgi:hypothetical protein